MCQSVFVSLSTFLGADHIVVDACCGLKSSRIPSICAVTLHSCTAAMAVACMDDPCMAAMAACMVATVAMVACTEAACMEA